MGFLEHLNGALQNNSNKVSDTRTTNPNFGYGFNSNALKQNELKQDTFTPANAKQYVSDFQINEHELALFQPIRFIRKYANQAVISNAISKNPNIERILKEHGLSTNFNMENINSIIMSHLVPTSKTAQRMYRAMGHNVAEINYLYLTQAALLHDIGKVFIPSEILNKKGKLSPKERSIIELHNQLSYEILKTTDLNPKVAQLAFEHHDYDKKVSRNHENQALTISDVFCALKEDRPYKKPITELCAKAILYDMGTKGNFDSRYINYLNA